LSVVVLEGRVAVQSQIILDHSVGGSSGHLLLGHFVSGEVLCCETTAIDAGLKVIRLAALGAQLGHVNAAIGSILVLLDLGIVGDLS
jgi:ammonia channel protein AmtB